jgi:UDPglucose 6-dehydrogenase
MNLAVIGSGYVGLVAGTCFAETGNDVVCVDIDEEKIDMLKSGKVPIYEPGLEEMVRRNAEDQRLSFTTDLASAVKKSEIIFIAVGTPQSATGHANLSYVEATARGIGKAMNGFKIIVTKSTVPVGTADLIKGWLGEETPQSFAVASNPEFMKEGAAVEDFMKNLTAWFWVVTTPTPWKLSRNSTSRFCAPAIRFSSWTAEAQR